MQTLSSWTTSTNTQNLTISPKQNFRPNQNFLQNISRFYKIISALKSLLQKIQAEAQKLNKLNPHNQLVLIMLTKFSTFSLLSQLQTSNKPITIKNRPEII